VYILTGEIHSGKTTAINKFIEGKKDVYGILTPDIDGERYFVDVHTNEQFKMRASLNETGVLQIGRYNFSKAAFEKASIIIREALKQNTAWLVIDEIGPLELKQQGFYDVLKEVLANENSSLKKLLVVRLSLVEEVVSFFQIRECKVVTSLDDL
jgi:nucleoside-triphosphatase THEP1